MRPPPINRPVRATSLGALVLASVGLALAALTMMAITLYPLFALIVVFGESQ